MPKWTPETDAKLLAAIIKTTDAKLDLSTVASLMSVEGDVCTAKALTHRIARIKVSAKEFWPDETAASVSAPAMPAPPPKTPRKRNGQATADGDADADDDASPATGGSAAKKAKTTKVKEEDGEGAEAATATATATATVEATPTKKAKGTGKPRGRPRKKASTAVSEQQVIKTEEGAETGGKKVNGEAAQTQAEDNDEEADEATAAGADA